MHTGTRYKILRKSWASDPGPSELYVTVLCRSKLNGRIYFSGRFFRVFERGQNNCYFDSAVKNTNMQHFFFRHRLVLTGTISTIISVK